uniref:Uncharacterized protein n=1 Tax=Meloidogyne enterolobii TaxID=390850 RepID=A0A6V7UKX6_MELEN|nr:unnamed protein product [Meloidogyne enterolobii]
MSSKPIHKFHVEMTCSGCSGQVQRVLGKLGTKFPMSKSICLQNRFNWKVKNYLRNNYWRF